MVIKMMMRKIKNKSKDFQEGDQHQDYEEGDEDQDHSNDKYQDHKEEGQDDEDAQDFSLVHSVIIAIGSSHWSDPTCQTHWCFDKNHECNYDDNDNGTDDTDNIEGENAFQGTC